MLTIFIPSRYESVDFLRALKGTRKSRIGDAPVFTGEFGGKPARIAICGMGQVHCARRIAAVLEATAPLNETEPVWLVGFGGGLDPSLKRLDIVYLLGNAPGAEAPILAASAALPAVQTRRAEKIYTSEVVVDTEEKKNAAFLATGAPIVDMETGPFLELLTKHGRTGAVIRVISDDVSEEFPADLIGWSHDFERGRDTPVRLAWYLLTHPADLVRMRRFLAPLPNARRRLLEFVTAAATSI
ncbi:MAG: hypothetical protein LBS59_07705 [Puniceicoccales bacterium]|jgi:purine-nucleoside phosphorylase|nr:hypothetical protein [Puniceicoccales bacterium]